MIKLLSYLFKNNTPSKINPKKDRRGKHVPAHKIVEQTKSLIRDHIESFHPAVPHYRRAHAPLRRYLPPELNVKLMFEQFEDSHPNVKCKERTYRRELSDMSVSFAKLGEEECKECRKFSLHSHENDANILATRRTTQCVHSTSRSDVRSRFVGRRPSC